MAGLQARHIKQSIHIDFSILFDSQIYNSNEEKIYNRVRIIMLWRYKTVIYESKLKFEKVLVGLCEYFVTEVVDSIWAKRSS